MKAFISRGAVSIFVQKVGGLCAAFGLQVALARLLGPTEFGLYSVAMSVMTIVAIIAASGLPTAAVRTVAKGCARGGEAFIGRYRTHAVVRLGKWSFIVILTAHLFFVLFPDKWFQRPSIILLAVYAGVFLAALRLQSGIIRGADFPNLSFWPEHLGRPILILVGCSTLAMLHIRNAEAVFIVSLISVLGLVVVQEVLFSIKRGKIKNRCHEATVCKSSVLTENINFFFGLAVAQNLIERMDVLLMSAFLSPKEIGSFFVAARVSALIAIALASANLFFSGKMARAYELGDKDTLTKYVRQSIAVGFLPSIPAFLVLVFFGEYILRIFGDGYVTAYHLLILLSAAQLYNSFCGPALVLLNMTGHVKDSFFIFLTVAVVGGVGYLFVAPEYGVEGFCAVSAAVIIIWNTAAVVMVRKRLQLNLLTIMWR
jgi:O-antigen/teichoic acid export membrane protein